MPIVRALNIRFMQATGCTPFSTILRHAPEADEANLKPNAQHIGKCKNCVIFKLAALDLICQSAVGQGETKRRRWAWETAGGGAALRSLALVLGFAAVVVVVTVVLPFLFTNMQKRNCVLSCLC